MNVHFPAPPNAPTDLSASKVKETTLTLTWSASVTEEHTPVEAYTVEIKKGGDKEYSELAQVSSTTMTYSVTELKEETKYEFAVKAQNEAGVSQAAKLKKAVKTKAKIGGYQPWINSRPSTEKLVTLISYFK